MMSTIEASAVTVIGLGDMGRTLAVVLLKHGFAVTVWNRTASRAASLVDQGAILVTGVSEALAAAPVTIVCLSNHAATMQVLAGDAVGAAEWACLDSDPVMIMC